MRLSDYELNNKLYESNLSIVYRAKRKTDKQSVIVKILNEEYPSKEQLIRFNYEYEILKSFNTESVVKAYSLEKYGNSAAIVEEDFGGSPLNIYNWQSLNLADILKLFIKITDIIEEIHGKDIIHKDISPSNILWNSKTDQVKIIDFGIATRLSYEKSEIINHDVLEGKLAYISPEQTGRMNRTVDYRSDFYSLGATFYEVLTNKQPFTNTKDKMELVHCHLAKHPIAPHEVNSEIPTAVSKIIQKLMSKNAEARYQSTFGLKSDLQECLNQVYANGAVEEFELCKNDQLSKFQIPQRLYGRKNDIEILMKTFRHVCDGNTEIMLVSGFAGIGKSMLVNEIHKPIVQQRAYFISGKYDQFKRNIPYRAIIDAFQELIQKLLTESAEKIKFWKERFLNTLGSNGQVIIDVIPKFELIIGKQKPVQNLPPTESQNRFNMVFQNFIHTIASKDHPLVIFLDDLQWADNASLKFIEILLSSQEDGYLFIIGSYRDNEVDKSHPLKLAINNMTNKGVLIRELKLSPLEIKHINQLIADSVNCKLEKAKPLAELVLSKTEGNPFFITEFLRFLYEEKLISFDYKLLSWEWELKNIKKMGITDNVVELMAGKIKSLTSKTQKILKLAACIGNNFDLKTLAIIYEKSKIETASDLWGALQSYMILPVDDSYRYTHDVEDINPKYKFVHDRIQQAVYSLIPDDEKKGLHLQIGRLLLGHLSKEEQAEHIFDIISHLNLAEELITEKSEKIELARFNLIAGKKAKNSTAYAPALDYIKTGINLLGKNGCEIEYDLCLKLYIEGAEVAYLNGEFEYMEQLSKVVLEKAKTSAIKAEIFDIRIRTYIAKNNPAAAINAALQALSLLGVNISENPSEADIGQGLMGIQAILEGKQVEDLIKLPKMTDPDKLAAMQIISTVMPITYVAAPRLVPMLAFSMVDLSVNFGNAPASTFGYATYGLILCGSVGNIDSGYKFGELALNLLEHLNAEEYKPRTYFYVYMFISHWKQHLRNSLAPALEAYRSGLEIGDLANSTLNTLLYGHHAYIAGKELSVIADEMQEYSNTMSKFNQDFALSYNELYRYAVLSWIKQGEDESKAFYEDYYQKMLPALEETQNISAIWIIYLNKAIFNYVFERFTEAYENTVQAEKYIAAATGAITPPLFYFYDSLIRLSMYSDVQEPEQTDIIKKVEANQEKIKNWAEHAPMNFLHKWTLVEAEKARILGRDREAEKYYEEAIDLAQKNEYLNEEALAYELASSFYLDKDRKRIAACYLREAYYTYQRWGAIVKVEDLRKRHSDFLSQFGMKHTESAITNTSSSRTTTTTTLDLTSVLKASQNISGKIELRVLLDKMMKVIIENAGAQRGFLVLGNENEWFIEAEGEIEQREEEIRTRVLTSLPLTASKQFSESIIRYVIRTKESIVLNNASAEGIFTQDSYIVQNRPKSIICAPLIKQGKLIGIVYLENNLTIGAFTSDRLQLLNLLSSQAAISVENARIYEKLEVLVKNRTEALNQKNKELERITLELREVNSKLRKLASEDSLTGLYNRRKLYFVGEKLLKSAIKEKLSISLLMLDIDYFKLYNDTYGHQEGDKCLIKIAEIIKKRITLRKNDVVARYGGEEFICILFDISEEETLKIANKLCLEIEKANLPHKSSQVSNFITSSIGLTNVIPDEGIELEDLIKLADNALYKAKEHGRNKAVIL